MSPIIPNPLVRTLPVWAREHISALESKVINQQRAIDVFTGTRESHISWNDWLNNEWHNIPDSCRVRYELEGQVISIGMEPDRCFINLQTEAIKNLSVESVSGNRVKVR